jgi:hypothetical protein
MLYTRRADHGSVRPDRQSVGADFQLSTSQFRGDQNLEVNGYYLKTPDGVRKGDDAAFGMRVLYPNDIWSGRLILKEFQRNFDPAVGFRQRDDTREYGARWKYAPRPKNSRIVRQAGAEVWLDWFSDTRGRWYEKHDQYIFDIDLQSGDTASLTIIPAWERLLEPFRIAPGVTLPTGHEYDYTRYTFRGDTANQRPVALSATVSLGTFYSGDRRDLNGTITVRPRRGILLQLTGQFTRVELLEGRFSTRLLRGQINTQFSPFVSLSNNIQYDSVSRVLGWQSRFRWITQPGNDIYFVWMTNWIDTETRLSTLDRNAAVKLLYTYRL